MGTLIRAFLVVLAITLAAQGAFAEACTKSSGYSAWTTLGEVSIWSGCTAGTGDDFTISGTAEVVIDGLLAITTGTTTITCDSGGTLRVTPGSGIDATGATAVTLAINDGCNFQPQGEVIYKGRVASTTTHDAGPPATGTITVTDGGSPTAVGAAATDLVYFPYPRETFGPIRPAIQSSTGAPLPGYFKPSSMAGAFASLESLSATEIEYHTAGWVSEAGGTDGGAADPYNGVRGPGLASATAATVARTRGGIVTKVSLDVGVDLSEGDLTDQAVRFTTGTCAGRNPYPIMYTDANTSTTPDDLYVLGDASECSGGDIVIEEAPSIGDPVWIVRPVIFEGAGVLQIVINGGTLAGEWIDARNLGGRAHPSLTLPAHGNIIIAKPAAGATPPTGYLRHVRVAYPRVSSAGTATGAILAVNSNSSLNAYLQGAGETWDLSGLELSEWHIADQFQVGTGVEGVHGILAYSIASLNADRFRVERLGDDGVAWISGSFGAGDEQTIRLREWQVMAGNNDGGGGAFSQQCTDFSGGSTSFDDDVLHSRATLEDSFLRGCDDGVIAWKVLGSNMRRVIAGGSVVDGVLTGVFSGSYAEMPASSIETYPNTISDSILLQLTGTAIANGMVLNGKIVNSVVAGNLIGGAPANGSAMKDATGVYNSLIDYGNDSSVSDMFARGGTEAFRVVANITVRDSVLMNSSTGSTPLFASNFATTTAANFDIDRTIIAVDSISAGTGYLDNSDAVFTDARDLRLSMVTPTAGGLRGLAGTALGATVSETCVESTLANALTGAANFGSARTSTSIEVDDMRPDAPDDVPIAAFLDGAPSLCESPRSIGPTAIGFAYTVAGPGLTLHPEVFSTSSVLLREVRGDGVGGSPFDPPGMHR